MTLFTLGPVQTHQSVRVAMAQDIAPWNYRFRNLLVRVQEKILKIANGNSAHVALPFPAPGHFVNEATIRSLTKIDGKILIPVTDCEKSYTNRLAKIARESKRQVVPLLVKDTSSVTAELVYTALEKDREIKHVAIVYSETGSGIVNDIKSIGEAVRLNNCRMIVDAVSAFGALPFDFEQHPECDAITFTSGKCLEGMPGLGFVIARKDAIKLNQGQAESQSMDLADVLNYYETVGPGYFRFTPPAQVIAALDVALTRLEQEGGPKARLRRYRNNADIIYNRLSDIGLTPYLKQAEQGPIVVNAHWPSASFDFYGFITELIKKDIVISGFYTTQSPTIRIGAIGAIGEVEVGHALLEIEKALHLK